MTKQKRLGRLVLALGCFTLFAQGVGMAGFPRCKEEMGDTHI